MTCLLFRGALESSAIFDANHVKAFVHMTGDSNPIHTSRAAAEAQGMSLTLTKVSSWYAQGSCNQKDPRPQCPMQALRIASCQECCARLFSQQS